MKFIKSFFLTLLYTILLILILEIINWLMLQIIEKTVSPLFVWFYNLHWIWKLILIFFGGTLAITFFLSLLNYLAAVISTIIQFVFPYVNSILFIGNRKYLHLRNISMEASYIEFLGHLFMANSSFLLYTDKCSFHFKKT